VKAALANHSAQQKQPVILSSKRTINTSTITKSVENPFPVDHIKEKVITSSISPTNELSSDTSEDDDEGIRKENGARNEKQNQEEFSNRENELINKLNSVICESSKSRESSKDSTQSPTNQNMDNVHVNQYYYHVNQLQIDNLNLHNNKNLTKLNNATDRIANKQSSSNVASKNIEKLQIHKQQNDEKCKKLQQQQKHKQTEKIKSTSNFTSTSCSSSSSHSTYNKSKKQPNDEKIKTTSSLTSKQDETTTSLNNSALNDSNEMISSTNEANQIQRPTKVSTKIQQLLNTLKVRLVCSIVTQ
jgi:hypothetical protein